MADLGALACALARRLTNEEVTQIVGIGDSGADFARRVYPDARQIGVTTVRFDRDRAKRELFVGALPCGLDRPLVLVDDVMVSGRTLQIVQETLDFSVKTAGVGLLYDSTRSRRRSGIPDVRFGLLYSRIGGGSPPTNSIATLRAIPDRLDELAERYFRGSETFKRIVRGGDL